MFGLNLAQKNNKSNEIQNKNTKIDFFLPQLEFFSIFFTVLSKFKKNIIQDIFSKT